MVPRAIIMAKIISLWNIDLSNISYFHSFFPLPFEMLRRLVLCWSILIGMSFENVTILPFYPTLPPLVAMTLQKSSFVLTGRREAVVDVHLCQRSCHDQLLSCTLAYSSYIYSILVLRLASWGLETLFLWRWYKCLWVVARFWIEHSLWLKAVNKTPTIGWNNVQG